QFGVGTAPEERRTHQPDDFPQELVLAAQAPCDLDHQVSGESQLLQSLLQDLSGVLRLAAVALEAFSGGAAPALSGFGVAFLIGCGTSHSVLLRVWSVACGVPCGSLEPQTEFPRVRRCLGAARPTRRGSLMDFYAVLDQVLALLRQRGRVSYRALKRQFALDDTYLDDLKVEIIEILQCAVDQGGTMLVWMGDTVSAASPASVQAQAPRAYTP